MSNTNRHIVLASYLWEDKTPEGITYLNTSLIGSLELVVLPNKIDTTYGMPKWVAYVTERETNHILREGCISPEDIQKVLEHLDNQKILRKQIREREKIEKINENKL